ncbi:protein translocase subunit SecF [Patescibacteria group bacterium]|nr:protein translocase subunit SecF [Patescibacteria group bacterium]
MNILGARKIWLIVSLVLILSSITSISVFGYRTGIDFAGGTNLEVQLAGPKDGAEVKPAIIEAYKQVVGLDVAPQSTEGDRYFIRSAQIDNQNKNDILAFLQTKFDEASELRFESVDPTISADIVRKAILAVIIAALGIMLYLAYAFRRVPKPLTSWDFGFGALVALVHDVIILLGAYSVMSHYFGAEVDGMFIAALLTLLGFSVHDTIVTFDRIRENLRRRAGEDLITICNDSISETVVRSINTSFTVVLVLLAMTLFGGATLKFFTLALLIGIVIGTYSSIFIAAPILLWMGRRRER